ncbi:hypothetical protein EUTSA_v10026498mg [Eutrema salsugineum]|uniref:Uncharacterized protein n=1 Tax=Eutrema salsugineum TaxID=72664 RepID=V4MDL0_EUTSA|nr:uncharacterized protein LOC18030106 [Eutrema salsugineum]ESQ53312.1 hypothetical protein EUTSA_v10026498mg [Eutrema salsugineum]
MSKKKETKLSKYMKVPIKMVVKGRDLYIKSMNQFSSHDLLGSGMAFGIPVCQVSALPRSFSASHSQNSVRAKEHRVPELVRAASARNTTVDTQHGPSTKLQKAKSVRNCDVPHGFERIDETRPLIDLGSINHKVLEKSKSKSYGVVKYT